MFNVLPQQPAESTGCRRGCRVRIDGRGRVEVVDPAIGHLDLLRSIDPSFRIQVQPLVGFVAPRFQALRVAGAGLPPSDLASATDEVLWSIAGASEAGSNKTPGEASLLDIYIELARRMLEACSVCEHRCGVNRLLGQTGVCRLSSDTPVAEHFTHIGEEPSINPSYVLNLAGCALRCRYCQQSSLLDPSAFAEAPVLAPTLWQRMDLRSARSISFAGGNPDESIFSILRFLRNAPEGLCLPLVWNTHGYVTAPTLRLLTKVADVYLPDLKYGHDECAKRWSGVVNYVKTVQASITSMAGAGIPTIVRILVLPGHFECCHKPTLRFLASLPTSDNLYISIRAQYAPDWKIKPVDGQMARRPLPREIQEVRRYADSLGLNSVQ